MGSNNGKEIFATWQADLLAGKPPVYYQVGFGGFQSVELAPGRVVMVGAPPAVGKTALTMQWGFQALKFNPTCRVLVCNVEMTAGDLLERELARVSGVSASAIQHRQFRGDLEKEEKIKKGLAEIERIADKMDFLRPPFAMDNVVQVVKDTGADMIILDYIQRFAVSSNETAKDQRTQLTEVMGIARQIANEWQKAVIVVSAVGRGNGKEAYGNIGLGSFRESSELEYGADDGYVLSPEKEGMAWNMMLKHVKARRQRKDIPLWFNADYQRFHAVDKGANE